MKGGDGGCNLGSDPLGCVTGDKRASIFSPKLGIVLGPWAETMLFLNAGDGYHSNDARGVTRSGQNPQQLPVTPLTRAAGAEIGAATQFLPDLESRLDVFQLKLKSELVFDGDAGVTTPSGATTRRGIEWSNTYRFNSWLAADLNTAFTRARFDSSAPAVGRYVPNSPTNVIDAGLTAQRESGWFGSVHARHFGESPLVEDNSARSPAYTTVDAQFGIRHGQWTAALDIFNLANVKWNDIEYYYVSRLKNEPAPVPGYEVHPGVPRTLRAHLQYLF
jgi:hypothetical protein